MIFAKPLPLHVSAYGDLLDAHAASLDANHHASLRTPARHTLHRDEKSFRDSLAASGSNLRHESSLRCHANSAPPGPTVFSYPAIDRPDTNPIGSQHDITSDDGKSEITTLATSDTMKPIDQALRAWSMAAPHGSAASNSRADILERTVLETPMNTLTTRARHEVLTDLAYDHERIDFDTKATARACPSKRVLNERKEPSSPLLEDERWCTAFCSNLFATAAVVVMTKNIDVSTWETEELSSEGILDGSLVAMRCVHEVARRATSSRSSAARQFALDPTSVLNLSNTSASTFSVTKTTEKVRVVPIAFEVSARVREAALTPESASTNLSISTARTKCPLQSPPSAHLNPSNAWCTSLNRQRQCQRENLTSFVRDVNIDETGIDNRQCRREGRVNVASHSSVTNVSETSSRDLVGDVLHLDASTEALLCSVRGNFESFTDLGPGHAVGSQRHDERINNHLALVKRLASTRERREQGMRNRLRTTQGFSFFLFALRALLGTLLRGLVSGVQHGLEKIAKVLQFNQAKGRALLVLLTSLLGAIFAFALAHCANIVERSHCARELFNPKYSTGSFGWKSPRSCSR